MSKIKSFMLNIFIITMILTAVSVLSMPSAYAEGTHANSATSFSGTKTGSTMHGDSYITEYGNFAKITLYLATTNDPKKGIVFTPDGTIDMTKTPATRLDGEPMFVKFGQSIIDAENIYYYVPSYANLKTNKLDTLIDLKRGEKRYPEYDSSSILKRSDLATLEIPPWLTYDEDPNHTAVISWFTAEGDAKTANDRLFNIIMEVARRSDDTNSIQSKIKNTLAIATQKAKFAYIDKSGKEVSLSYDNISPDLDLVYWLIVYEPVINYAQDPHKLFYPTTGGNSFLFTASDAILQNMNSGAPGYPSVEKFANGNPIVTMKYNHCNLCDLTWFGYPDWPHSSFPLATYCPLPCLGTTRHYDGVQTLARRPFAINNVITNTSRLFTVKESWLKYSGGYLCEKPPASIDSMIISVYQSEDNILQYGGYSLFVNGPKAPESKNSYIRVTGLNGDDNTLVPIPGVAVELSIKNDVMDSLKQQVEAAANSWIGTQPADTQPQLMSLASDIQSESFVKTVVTQTDYVKIPFEEKIKGSVIDFTPLIANYKLYPTRITVEHSISMPHYNAGSVIDKKIDSGSNLSNSEQSKVYIETIKEVAETAKLAETDDGAIELIDGTILGRDENISLNWNKYLIVASERKDINSLEEIVANMSEVCLYDTDSGNWVIPDNFTFVNKDMYITVIVAIITPPISPDPAIPSDNVIKENELTRAMTIKAVPGASISRITVAKTSVDTTCPGYYLDWVPGWVDNSDPENPVEHPGYEVSVPCGHSHTLSNAKNVVPRTLSVQTSWYWNISMFSNVSRLSALRKDGALTNDGVSFVFNTTSPFTSSDMGNAFDSITEYRFIAHRSADGKNDGSVKPLQLAAYMNDTTLNSNYLNFINPYYGGTYPSAYSNPTGHFGKNDYTLITSINLPSASAVGSGDFCSGGSSNSLSIPVKLSGEINLGVTAYEDSTFKTFTEVEVDPTIKSKNKAAPALETEAVYWGLGDKDLNPSYFIKYESQPITFNPAFKMKYQDSNNPASPFKEVWMLAAGEKTFKSYDLVTYEILDNKIDVTAPWSRDSEDRWVDPNANSRVARDYPTAKSGTMVKADASGTTLRITVNVHLQDPHFVDPSRRAAVQAQNDTTIEYYDDMVKAVIAKLQNDGISYYSNLLQATTPETIHHIPAGNNALNNSAKSAIRLASVPDIHANIVTLAAFLDNDKNTDGPARTITIKGQNVALRRWVDNSIIKSNAILDDLLAKNEGSKGWYNESYEGIIVVTRTYLLELSSIESDFAQIHPQLSDWLTERNAYARELDFVPDNRFTLIPAGQFGIGLELRFPEIVLGGETFKPVLCGYPYNFDIRGSVYDTK